MKTMFEEIGGSYTQVGDYQIPDLILPETKNRLHRRMGQTVRDRLFCYPQATYFVKV